MNIKITSWNLWFDYLHQETRIISAMDELLRTDSDIICCQEVTNSILQIMKNHAIAKHYTIFYDEFSTQTYGEIFLVKNGVPIKKFYSTPFPTSNMGRRIYILETQTCIIANIHLESEFSGQKSGTKAVQFKYLFDFMNKTYPQHYVIIVGDTNITDIDDKNWASQILNSCGFIDYFGIKKQNTYDYILNTNVLNCYRSRLDRCYIKYNDKLKNLKGNFQLIGLNTIPSIKIHPSDHFGVCIKFAN